MKTCRGWLLSSCAAGVLLCLPASAQEWTRFRGPNGTGIANGPNIPVECTETNRNWAVKLPGTGHSSPVIWGNRIFVTSAEADAGKRHLLCLNTADGKELWRRTYPFQAYSHHRYNNAASSTPAVDGERVYVAWIEPRSYTVVALDHGGNEIWKRDLGPWEGNHGGGTSPILVGDLVIVRSDSDEKGPASFVMGLDRKTGAVRWKTPRTGKSASYSTPVLYQPKGGPAELVFTSQAHGFTGIDPRTGAVNWELPGVFKQRCVSGPVILGGLLFGTSGNGGGARQGVAVRPGKGQAAVQYEIPRGVPYVPTPLVIGDRMFLWGDNGIVTCVQAGTGEQLWSERVGGNYFGSPVCVSGKIYAISANGDLVVIAAADEFKLLGRSSLGEPSHSTPAVSNGVMYLRTESRLISLGGKKK